MKTGRPLANARRRPALILPIVLVLIGLLAVTLAGFTFFVNAEIAGLQAHRDALQARLAAESGLEELITILRTGRDDPGVWYDVPDRFRHALVWAETYARDEDPVRKMGSRKDILESRQPAVAWRYSVVAQNLDGLPQTFRFGITPEAGKLNLNSASEDEITRLLVPLLQELQVGNAEQLVDALLDWRDADDDVRAGGAENEYYTNLQPAYVAKNGPLDTLEELLQVKGWTAAVLYGEDTNRNGLLDPNEDDGDLSFPYYDNGDGILNHGIAPFVTVWSREPRATSQQPPPGGSTEREQQGEREQGPYPGEEDGSFPESPWPSGADETEAGDKSSGRSSAPPPGRRGATTPGTEQPATSPGAPTGPGGALAQGTGSQMYEGPINVNTAPLRVLAALDGMPAGAAEAIVARRQELSPEALAEPDWLVTSGTLDAGTLALIADRLTTRALQFHVEIVAYGDHTKLARRYEWIIELRGSVAQILYHRELTGLGFAWPVDDDTLIVSGR